MFLALHATCFLGGDLIERLVHFVRGVEAVEDVQGLGAFLTDNVQIGLPFKEYPNLGQPPRKVLSLTEWPSCVSSSAIRAISIFNMQALHLSGDSENRRHLGGKGPLFRVTIYLMTPVCPLTPRPIRSILNTAIAHRKMMPPLSYTLGETDHDRFKRFAKAILAVPKSEITPPNKLCHDSKLICKRSKTRSQM
jgi:hypothetical protein